MAASFAPDGSSVGEKCIYMVLCLRRLLAWMLRLLRLLRRRQLQVCLPSSLRKGGSLSHPWGCALCLCCCFVCDVGLGFMSSAATAMVTAADSSSSSSLRE
ncbi:hypothetical protein PVAP13_4KG409500 [Panicum virgatum]|uniref:Uncharacterized protein n=1 Tax=Panicum virgatum TaxID=38727 RepID=A0A8T0U0D1_PANVG|nr:hypothetical protein PVAP13_4KG409500 [Panicum virgatum]